MTTDALNRLRSLVEVEEFVALAGPSVKAAAYVFAGLNKKWNPLDHPRDPNTGEFVKGPTGFIFGKTKSATFPLHGQAKKVDLKPGDVAFETPAGNVVVSHADGSYSLHHGKGKVSKIPAGNNSAIAAGVMEGSYKKVAENPGVAVEAQDQDARRGRVARYDQGRAGNGIVQGNRVTVVLQRPGGNGYFGKVIDAATRDGIALLDGPFHRGEPAMPGQQGRVVTDAAKPCRLQCLPADAGVAMRCHDQVGVRRDLRRRHQLGIRLHGRSEVSDGAALVPAGQAYAAAPGQGQNVLGIQAQRAVTQGERLLRTVVIKGIPCLIQQIVVLFLASHRSHLKG